MKNKIILSVILCLSIFLFANVGFATLEIDLQVGDNNLVFPTGFNESNHTYCSTYNPEAYANISQGYVNASFKLGFTDGDEMYGNYYFDIAPIDDPNDANTTFCNLGLDSALVVLDNGFDYVDNKTDNKWENLTDVTYHDDDKWFCYGTGSLNETCDGIVNVTLGVESYYDVYVYGNCNSTYAYNVSAYNGTSWTNWKVCSSDGKHWFHVGQINVTDNPLRLRFISGIPLGKNGEIDAIRIITSSYPSEYAGGLYPLSYLGVNQPEDDYIVWSYGYNMTDSTCLDSDIEEFYFKPLDSLCSSSSSRGCSLADVLLTQFIIIGVFLLGLCLLGLGISMKSPDKAILILISITIIVSTVLPLIKVSLLGLC